MDMITRAIGPDAAPAGQVCPVNSHNEWDPLEEVIVGRLEGATIPSDHPVVTCNIPGMTGRAQSLLAGFRYPKIMIEPAQRELDGFVALLQSLGIGVKRPEPVEHKKRFSTPEWSSCGFCNSCPRDSMLVIGDEIIETPMAWPCRYFGDALLSSDPEGLLPTRRALDRRAQAATDGRAVRYRVSRPQKRRADLIHPD